MKKIFKLSLFIFLIVPFNSWANSPILLSDGYADSDTCKMVLEKFPIGTLKTDIIEKFPSKFVSFDVRFDNQNGIRINKDDIRLTGVTSIIVVIYKSWPNGFTPMINYRYLCLAFDENGKMIAIAVLNDTNSV